MSKIVFNNKLIADLPRIYNQKVVNFVQELGRSYRTWYKCIDEGEVRIDVLLDICNKKHVNIGRCFVTEEEYETWGYEDSMNCYCSEDMKILVSPYETVIIGNGKEYTWMKVAKSIGCDHNRAARLTRIDKTPICYAKNIVAMANTCGIPIGKFFSGIQGPHPFPSAKNSVFPWMENIADEKDAALLQAMAVIEKQMAELRKMLEER